MHYFIFPDIDNTLYFNSSSMNTGLDEILEIRKDVARGGSDVKVSRILMKFDLSEISQSIVKGIITNPKFYLNLYDANSTELGVSQSLWAYPVSQSWDGGEGFRFDFPVTQNGSSWDFRTSKANEDYWRPESGSESGSYFQGGAWFNNVYGSQSFEYETKDMRMDVTPVVNKWLDGTYPNEGFIIKRSGSIGDGNLISGSGEEGNGDKLGHFSFFSRQTNTIYPPKLEVQWEDAKYSTGSLSGLDSSELEDLVVYMKNIRDKYKEKSKVKFRVSGRGRYPTKTYSTTSSPFLTTKFLPISQSSGDGFYYSVKDAETEDVIIPFGSGSLVSCDTSGNYFNLWLNGFQAERYYRFEFKMISGSGTVDETVQYFDDNFTFKVVR